MARKCKTSKASPGQEHNEQFSKYGIIEVKLYKI